MKFPKDSVMHDKNVTIVAQVRKEKSRWNAYDQHDTRITGMIATGQRIKAFKKKMALRRDFFRTDGRPYWKLVPMSEYDSVKRSSTVNNLKTAAVNLKATLPSSSSDVESEGAYTPFKTQQETINFINNAISLKPKSLFMKEVKWKHLVRTVVRGRNVLIVGMQGAGKTLAARTVAKVLKRPFFSFPLGETQDPKGFLLGNSQYDKDSGTVFYPSRFVRAIQTPGAVIILDELSRAHPDAWNILMTPTDYTQRYLVLDETRDNEIVRVAEGVTFVATANIGAEFTATRTMDAALLNRFTRIEMDVLNADEEYELLHMMYPTIDEGLLRSVATIADKTRQEMTTENPKLSTALSTRLSVEAGGLLYDGFSLSEVAEVVMYPEYPNEGGINSERTYIKQIVQGFIDDGASKNLFTPEDKQKAKTA